MTTDFRLEPIASRPDTIATLAKWHFDEWRQLFPHYQLNDFADELARSGGLISTEPPQAFAENSWVLLDPHGSPAGSCSLLSQDMTINQHLGPWLANIYIRPDLRGQGLGQLLIKQVLTAAKQHHYHRLYLFTEDQQALYQRFGFQIQQYEYYQGHWVSVMACQL